MKFWCRETVDNSGDHWLITFGNKSSNRWGRHPVWFYLISPPKIETHGFVSRGRNLSTDLSLTVPLFILLRSSVICEYIPKCQFMPDYLKTVRDIKLDARWELDLPLNLDDGRLAICTPKIFLSEVPESSCWIPILSKKCLFRKCFQYSVALIFINFSFRHWGGSNYV